MIEGNKRMAFLVFVIVYLGDRKHARAKFSFIWISRIKTPILLMICLVINRLAISHNYKLSFPGGTLINKERLSIPPLYNNVCDS